MKKYGEYAQEMKERIAREQEARKVKAIGTLELKSIEPGQVAKYGLKVGSITPNSKLQLV